MDLSIQLPVKLLHYRAYAPYPAQERARQEEMSAVIVGATEILRQLTPQEITTLRYFALTGAWALTDEESEYQNPPRNGSPEGHWWEGTRDSEDSEDESSEQDEDAFEELERPQPQYLSRIRTSTRRWRVLHEGLETRLELLTIRDAGKVRRYIDEADIQGIERVHGE